MTHRWDSNSFTTPSQSGPESNGNEEVLHIHQTPRPESHNQMYFNVILRTRLHEQCYCYDENYLKDITIKISTKTSIIVEI